jgi:hypothetical protein
MSFLNLLEGLAQVIIAVTQFSNLEKDGDLRDTKTAVIVNTLRNICDRTNLCNETAVATKVAFQQPGFEGSVTLFTVCLLVGILSILNGLLLLIGLIQAKERYVLWYLLSGSACLFIVTVYTGINMFANKYLLLLFVVSIFMWYGQFSMYNFYEEVAEYNTVKAGVIEIAYTGDANSYVNSMLPSEGSIDNTSV